MDSFAHFEPVPCPVVTVAPWPAYTFFRRQVRWSGMPISLRIFHSLLWSTIVKGYSIVNAAEVDILLEVPCFLHYSMNVGNLISDFCLFLMQLVHLKGLSHILLKSSLNDFEHSLASMWNEHSCMVVWIFFGIAFLWDWNENWPFLVLWTLLGFPNFLTCWVQQFNHIIFKDFK